MSVVGLCGRSERAAPRLVWVGAVVALCGCHESATATVDAGAADVFGQDIAVLVECGGDADCSALAKPCLQGVCAEGLCQLVAVGNGKLCSDGNACTTGDVCDDGACVGVGECQCNSKGDCAAFEDGDWCNGVLFCDLGSHTCKVDPSTVIDCESAVGPACTVAVCAPKTGACESKPAALGSACDDGLTCTKDDTCGAAGCVGIADQVSGTCDDGNACTDDGCDVALGCVSLPMKATCDDGDACTWNLCEEAKGCVSLPKKLTCDDGDGCTMDTCEPATGCVNMPIETTCTN